MLADRAAVRPTRLAEQWQSSYPLAPETIGLLTMLTNSAIVIAPIMASVTIILRLPRSAPKTAGRRLVSKVSMRSTIPGKRSIITY